MKDQPTVAGAPVLAMVSATGTSKSGTSTASGGAIGKSASQSSLKQTPLHQSQKSASDVRATAVMTESSTSQQQSSLNRSPSSSQSLNVTNASVVSTSSSAAVNPNIKEHTQSAMRKSSSLKRIFGGLSDPQLNSNSGNNPGPHPASSSHSQNDLSHAGGGGGGGMGLVALLRKSLSKADLINQPVPQLPLKSNSHSSLGKISPSASKGKTPSPVDDTPPKGAVFHWPSPTTSNRALNSSSQDNLHQPEHQTPVNTKPQYLNLDALNAKPLPVLPTGSSGPPPALALGIPKFKGLLGLKPRAQNKLGAPISVPSLKARDTAAVEDDVVADLPSASVTLPAFVKRMSGIDSAQLTEWLMKMTPTGPATLDEASQALESKLLIFDYRTALAGFNLSRILGSFNLFLMAKKMRVRRDSVQSLSMNSIIMDNAGKKVWRTLVGQEGDNPGLKTGFKIVVVDEDLPYEERGWASLQNESLPILLSLLEKETPVGNDIYWLKGGFSAFTAYCTTSNQKLPDGSTVPNSRWIWYGNQYEEVSSNRGDTLSVRPLGSNPTVTTSEPSLSPKAAGGRSLSALLHNFKPWMTAQDSSSLDVPQAPVEPISPAATRDHLDCHYIFDWLILGADPAVVVSPNSSPRGFPAHTPTNTTGNSFLIEIPSPSSLLPGSLNRPQSVTSNTAQVLTTNQNPNITSPTINTNLGSPPSFNSAMSPVSPQNNSHPQLPHSPGNSSGHSSTEESRRFNFGFMRRSFLPAITSPTGSTRPQSVASGSGVYANLQLTRDHLERLKVKCILNMALECLDIGPYFLQPGGVKGYQLDAYYKFGFWDKTDEDIEDSVNLAMSKIGIKRLTPKNDV